jgi:hypothetical protein
MIPVTQTKVVVRNTAGEIVQNGNCYAATDVPNVEVFFKFENGPWHSTMESFLSLMGWELNTDDRFKIFHINRRLSQEEYTTYLEYCKDKFYLVSGPSSRGVQHICIYRNGELVHDPHPTREGLLKEETFQELVKKEL